MFSPRTLIAALLVAAVATNIGDVQGWKLKPARAVVRGKTKVTAAKPSTKASTKTAAKPPGPTKQEIAKQAQKDGFVEQLEKWEDEDAAGAEDQDERMGEQGLPPPVDGEMVVENLTHALRFEDPDSSGFHTVSMNLPEGDGRNFYMHATDRSTWSATFTTNLSLSLLPSAIFKEKEKTRMVVVFDADRCTGGEARGPDIASNTGALRYPNDTQRQWKIKEVAEQLRKGTSGFNRKLLRQLDLDTSKDNDIAASLLLMSDSDSDWLEAVLPGASIAAKAKVETFKEIDELKRLQQQMGPLRLRLDESSQLDGDVRDYVRGQVETPELRVFRSRAAFHEAVKAQAANILGDSDTRRHTEVVADCPASAIAARYCKEEETGQWSPCNISLGEQLLDEKASQGTGSTTPSGDSSDTGGSQPSSPASRLDHSLLDDVLLSSLVQDPKAASPAQSSV